MLFPEITSLKVILSNPTTTSYIIDSLFIDEFYALVFRQNGLEFLQDFFAW
jgi:hypothetical protein